MTISFSKRSRTREIGFATTVLEFCLNRACATSMFDFGPDSKSGPFLLPFCLGRELFHVKHLGHSGSQGELFHVKHSGALRVCFTRGALHSIWGIARAQQMGHTRRQTGHRRAHKVGREAELCWESTENTLSEYTESGVGEFTEMDFSGFA